MPEADSMVSIAGARRARDKAAVDDIRVPPHSVEAEQAVLGGLMLDNRTWDAIADRLLASDFYRRDHQLIFEAIAELAAKSEPSDAVTLSEWLERKGLADRHGRPCLSRRTRARHARAPRTCALMPTSFASARRCVSLISVGGEIAASAYDPEGREAGADRR